MLLLTNNLLLFALPATLSSFAVVGIRPHVYLSKILARSCQDLGKILAKIDYQKFRRQKFRRQKFRRQNFRRQKFRRQKFRRQKFRRQKFRRRKFRRQ